jgi:hypothetical protein
MRVVAVKVARQGNGSGPAIPPSRPGVEADPDFAVLLAALTAPHAWDHARELRIPAEDPGEHDGANLTLVRASTTLHVDGIATEVIVEFLDG